MIKDTRIDLTLNNDFRHSLECSDLKSEGIRDYSPRRRVSLICEAGYDKIPWRYHELGEGRRYVNINNDYLSDEFGADIYFTSDNHVFVTDDETSYQRKTEELNWIMEEFFMEVVGYLPGTIKKRCYCCGKWFLDFTDMEYECPNCKDAFKYNRLKRDLFGRQE